MDKKVYLTSDQYVVAQLERKEEEIVELNLDINELSQQLALEKEKNERLKQVCGMFKLETTVDGNGRKIVFTHHGADYAVAYCFTEEYDNEFKELIELLGL